MKRNKNNTGFTLIELLVVISIIAVLLSILTPALKRAKDSANRVVCGTRLKQIGTAIKLYSDASKGLLPSDYNPDGVTRERHGFLAYRGNSSASQGAYYPGTDKLWPFRFAYLYEMSYIETPEIFYCPGNRLDSYKYKSYTNPGPWGTLDQYHNTTLNPPNQWVRVGYTYYPVGRDAIIDPQFRAPTEMATRYTQLSPNMPYASDLLHRRSFIAHQTSQSAYGVNALFPDGHVTYCNDQEVFALSIWDYVDKGVSNQREYDSLYYAVFREIRP